MALRKPLYEKCFELNHLFQEAVQTSNSESRLYFTSIIDEIFGTNRVSAGWGIKTTCREFNPSDYDCLFTFLKPDGSLFNWIQFLMNDRNYKFELPITYLKPSIQSAISSGVVPGHLAKRMNQTQCGLTLDPLEYFLFSFFIVIQSDSNKPQNMMLTGVDNATSLPVYIPLLESYLTFFLPLKSNPVNGSTSDPNQTQSSIWHSLSTTTSNLLHLGSSNEIHGPRMSTPRSSLLNVKSLLDQKGGNTNLSRPMSGSEISIADGFLNVLSEILLDIPDRNQVKKSRSPINRGFAFTPTQDHMRCVRVVIKHLHYFVNSAPGKDRLSDTQYRSIGSLDDIKRSVWSNKFSIQSRLYNLFRISFDLWPSDASFRLPLETWLSYIQPWRYLPGVQQDQSRDDAAQLSPVSDDWLPFIVDNLLFYDVIFLQVMARFTCLDMSTLNNAMMLNRVAKVYGHCNLDHLIKNAESSVDRLSALSVNPQNRHSLFSPSKSPVPDHDHTLATKHHLQEYEESNFELVPLFSSKSGELISEVLREINLAKAVVADELKTAAAPNISPVEESFFDGLKSFFSSDKMIDFDMDKKCKELKKVESFLTTSEARLREVFGELISGQEIINDPSIIAAKIRQRHLSTPSSSHKKPDFERDQFGTPKLTSAGRKQVLNRMAKPVVLLEGNPDIQPTRSFEVQFMVTLMILLSKLINDRVGTYIDRLYQSDSIISKVVRMFFSAPVTYTVTMKKGIQEAPERITHHLPARINLRFLANKTTIYGIISCILFKWLFNFGYLFLIFSIFLISFHAPTS